ncbi:MAG: 2-aminoethylphosphonate--pyruvate transaminase [Puniceicoccales bacterium]|nr:2-aminoethylphosphonate--pyruvate transaminase [Puniceicoccales bacterium]
MKTYENSYILLTPGPLSTSPTVREAMLRDWCTWDDDYNLGIVTPIREILVNIATKSADEYTTVLMQGSGTFSVEATLGSVIPQNGKVLVLVNGAYGKRMAKIASYLNISHAVLDSGETSWPDIEAVRKALANDPAITHVAMVHNETTTGMLNPVDVIGAEVKKSGKIFIVDAMSSFGGIPMDLADLGIDFLISSANKCIQGVPGFGFVIARRDKLARCQGQARSLSLDLYDQWNTMETGKGKWRFTSPTHTVRAFHQALQELKEEGGVRARNARYAQNHKILVKGMERLGFETLLPAEMQSPIITAFYSPTSPEYRFADFYAKLKTNGFVIYPGKVSVADTFRIGTIGHVFPNDFERLIEVMEHVHAKTCLCI